MKLFFSCSIVLSASSTFADASPVVRRWQDSRAVQGHDSHILSITLNSADQNLFLSTAGDGTASLWDAGTLSKAWTYSSPAKTMILSSGFSKSGRLVAFGSDNRVFVKNVFTGDNVAVFPEGARLPLRGEASMAGVVFSKDDSLLYTAQNYVYLWDLESKQCLRKFESAMDSGQLMNLKDMRLSNDERFLYVATAATFEAWDVSTGKSMRRFYFTEHPDFPEVAQVTPDGKFIGYGIDNSVKIVDTETNTVIRKIRAASEKVVSVKFTENGCCFVAASYDGTARMFEIATGVELVRLDDSRPPGQRERYYSISVLSEAFHILTGDLAGTIRLWPVPRL